VESSFSELGWQRGNQRALIQVRGIDRSARFLEPGLIGKTDVPELAEKWFAHDPHFGEKDFRRYGVGRS